MTKKTLKSVLVHETNALCLAQILIEEIHHVRDGSVFNRHKLKQTLNAVYKELNDTITIFYKGMSEEEEQQFIDLQTQIKQAFNEFTKLMNKDRFEDIEKIPVLSLNACEASPISDGAKNMYKFLIEACKGAISVKFSLVKLSDLLKVPAKKIHMAIHELEREGFIKDLKKESSDFWSFDFVMYQDLKYKI